jgi:hypothetical protein
MGTITLTVPKEIDLEYQIDNLKFMEQLLDWLQKFEPTKPPIQKNDPLLGLFANDAELIDQITESAMQARETTSLRYQDG